MRSSGRGKQWIVLLEAVDGDGGAPIDIDGVHRLVAACGTPAPTTLFSPDRYALQMQVEAPDAPSALSAAIGRWQGALRRCQLPEWDLVRSEVLTPDELESELEHADVSMGGDAGEQARPSHPARVDAAEEELLRRALFDPVTGLPSRELFLELVRCALRAQPAAPARQALVVVHVDLPEGIDSPDHPPADDVLAEVAHRLTGSVRDGDTLARVGPFEFGVLLEVRSADDTDVVTQRILRSIGWPSVGPARPPVGTAGVVLSSPGKDADQLLRMAEQAMRDAVGTAQERRRFSDRTGAPRSAAGRSRYPRPGGGVSRDTP